MIGLRTVGAVGKERTYISIDLKSFYASVECIERGLNPMTTNLMVADESRTEKTICLAVSPSLKSYGIPGRPRLFEVVQKIKEVNQARKRKASGRRLIGSSYVFEELNRNPTLEVGYIIAPPRMAYYMEYSTRIYDVYLKYVAPEDIQVYSIDEVFIDATHYLYSCNMTAKAFAQTIIKDVLQTTGITATAGIGTNLYLCKIAMDIMAKKMPTDEDGVRIAELDELSYRKELWDHKPLTSFWRVGKGIAAKLEVNGMHTMGDVALMSMSAYGENLLYKLFGVNAELLIDHAWGWEPCTIADIKAYEPESKSLVSGQVLQCPYDFEKAKLVVKEMADLLTLDLVDKGLVTDQIVLTVGYDIENMSGAYKGEVVTDRYGRKIPKHAHGTVNLDQQTSSARRIIKAAVELYDRIVDEALLIRRITISATKLVDERTASSVKQYEQMDLFTDYTALEEQRAEEDTALEHEKRMQTALLMLKKKYGKNAVLKGMNLEKGATAKDRNGQIGGHKA